MTQHDATIRGVGIMGKGEDHMTRHIKLGRLFGLTISYNLWAVIALAGALVAGVLIGVSLLNFSGVDAVLFSVGFAALHGLSELLHQFGHALAAYRTGYRMSGIHYWGPLAAAVYPEDEGELPPGIHVRRALGGPIFSATVAATFGLLLYAVPGSTGPLNWLMLIALLENIFVFTLGALVPVGTLLRLKDFDSDGDTLLKNWRASRAAPNT